jgi:hypothetical protein
MLKFSTDIRTADNHLGYLNAVTIAMEQLAHTSAGNFIHIFRMTGMQTCKYNSVSLLLDSCKMLRVNTVNNIRTTGEHL